MKTKNLLNVLAISFFILAAGVSAYAEPPQQSFIYVIDELEKYLREQEISLGETENIRDVATLGYLNALKRIGAPFGTLDIRIKHEAKEWLKIWCWFPSIPEEKKKKVKQELTQLRGTLAQAAYKKTLASLSVVPGLAVTSLGEIYSPKHLMEIVPPFGKSDGALVDEANTIAVEGLGELAKGAGSLPANRRIDSQIPAFQLEERSDP